MRETLLAHFLPLGLLFVAQVKGSGNVFAFFTPVMPPKYKDINDPSARTCIVSLVNKKNRPFRMKLRPSARKSGVVKWLEDGIQYGTSMDGYISIHFGAAQRSAYSYSSDCGSSNRHTCTCLAHFGTVKMASMVTFEMDDETELLAGRQPLPFFFDVPLLSGLPAEVRFTDAFNISEVDCYTFD